MRFQHGSGIAFRLEETRKECMLEDQQRRGLFLGVRERPERHRE
jgi:hypothetical protein